MIAAQKRLLATLHTLSDQQMLLFGLMLVRRALHLTGEFDRIWSTEITSTVQNSYERLCDGCGAGDHGPFSPAEKQALAARLEACTPHTEEYPGVEADIAQCVCIAMRYLVDVWALGSYDSIRYCSQKLFELVDIIYQNGDDIPDEDAYMGAEAEKQQTLLEKIEALPAKLSSQDVQAALALASAYRIEHRAP